MGSRSITPVEGSFLSKGGCSTHGLSLERWWPTHGFLLIGYPSRAGWGVKGSSLSYSTGFHHSRGDGTCVRQAKALSITRAAMPGLIAAKCSMTIKHIASISFRRCRLRVIWGSARRSLARSIRFIGAGYLVGHRANRVMPMFSEDEIVRVNVLGACRISNSSRRALV